MQAANEEMPLKKCFVLFVSLLQLDEGKYFFWKQMLVTLGLMSPVRLLNTQLSPARRRQGFPSGTSCLRSVGRDTHLTSFVFHSVMWEGQFPR